jgi:integrase
MASAKIDIYNRPPVRPEARMKNWQIPEAVKKNLVKFLEEAELGRVNRGVKASPARQKRYLDLLKIPFEFWHKSEDKITLQDVERFEKVLSSGELKTRTGGAYAHNTKIDMRKALRIYFRWKLGRARAESLVGWLDTRGKRQTPDYLSESQTEKLFKVCRSAKERFLITVLFDSGARAGEFLNLRYEDVQLPTGNDNSNYVKITLKEEYSKTKGRTIALYWKHSLESVREYLGQRETEGIRSDEPVYPDSYETTRSFIARLGKRVLGRRVNFHLFRHSSATYYASKLNRQELCYRYGWAFSSDMPDVYISRAGMVNKEVDQRFEATEIEDLTKRLNRQEEAKRMADEKIECLSRKLLSKSLILELFVKNRLGSISDEKFTTQLKQMMLEDAESK